MSYKQPIDSKRDQFRKYIESKGVIDTITKVLIKLLEAPVKPEHPMDFIRDNLGPTIAEKHRIEGLEQQVVDYKQEVCDLKSQIEELKIKLNENNKPIVNGSTEVKPDTPPSSTTNDSIQQAIEADSKTVENNQSSSNAENDESTEKINVESDTKVEPTTINGKIGDEKENTSENGDNKVSNEQETNVDSKEKSDGTADVAVVKTEPNN